MGFWRDVRKGMRARGVYLDAEQARLILSLAQQGAVIRPGGLHEDERDVLDRFAKRCRELS